MKSLRLLILIPMTGCAPLMNGMAPTDCYDATSGSISVTNSAGAVVIAKPAETVRFCPPSIRKVSPTADVAVGAPAVKP